MARWIDIALSDMRIPGAAAGGASYINTYAYNEDFWWGRNANGSNSSQYRRAGLAMGRYGSPEAFTTTNPDYSEISYLTDPTTVTQAWPRITFWNQFFLGETWKDQHMPGWANNTRIMSWDHQLWVKWKSTGQWQRLMISDSLSGANFSVQFDVEDYANIDLRTETGTGYPSLRLRYDTNAKWVPYWVFHGWTGGNITVPGLGSTDVADLVISQRTALVLHDPNGVDDRDYSRYMMNAGSDWYPAGSMAWYPGVGTGRGKFITAKYPDYHYHVLHTMTEAQFKAVNGYPSYFDGLTDGGGVAPPPPPEPEGRIALPSRGSWFAKETSGAGTWTTRAPSAVSPAKIRRPRRARLM